MIQGFHGINIQGDPGLSRQLLCPALAELAGDAAAQCEASVWIAARKGQLQLDAVDFLISQALQSEPDVSCPVAAIHPEDRGVRRQGRRTQQSQDKGHRQKLF